MLLLGFKSGLNFGIVLETGHLLNTRGSAIVKVPGDVPPARVYFFGLLV